MLTALLASKAQLFNAPMTYDMVQYLHDFGYTVHDAELQIFLQISKHHLHNLHLDQLIDLGVRVHGMPLNQLTSSLRAGIQVSHKSVRIVPEMCTLLMR